MAAQTFAVADRLKSLLWTEHMTASANTLPTNEQPNAFALIARLWTYWSMNHLKGPTGLARELAIFALHGS